MELLEKLKILNNHLITKNYQKVIEGCTKLLKENPNIPYALNLIEDRINNNDIFYDLKKEIENNYPKKIRIKKWK